MPRKKATKKAMSPTEIHKMLSSVVAVKTANQVHERRADDIFKYFRDKYKLVMHGDNDEVARVQPQQQNESKTK